MTVITAIYFALLKQGLNRGQTGTKQGQDSQITPV